MADKGILPVKLSLTHGDYYTLWAPKWREHGAEWQAFLGYGDDLYVFESPEALLHYIETTTEKHDLITHPKWAQFSSSDETRVVPDERQEFDLIGTPALLAEQPSHAAVSAVSRNFHMARSLGEVVGDTDVLVFFSSHSLLNNADRGVQHFSGSQGMADWTAIGHVILGNWDKVIDSLDKAVTVKSVDADVSDQAQRISSATAAAIAAAEAEKARKEEEAAAADPYDNSIWAAAGIDPIKVSIDGRTVYTLRTYLKGQPVFLGKYGEIFTFNSSKALARWIVEHDDHDLARVSTWEEIVTAANAGTLEIDVHKDNVYSFNGLTEGIKKGTEHVDTDQMARAYELLADASDWAADDSLNSFFLTNPRIQDYISYMLGSTKTAGYVPSPPFDEHAAAWSEMEKMLTNRFSKF
jgi:hypothetical protein